MSAIIVNYDLVMKDAADPSTSSASTNLNGDRYSEIMPVQRSFMGSIVAVNVAGPVGNWVLEGSNDFGIGDDLPYDRVNSENLITNWGVISTTSLGSTETSKIISVSDIGCRWLRLKFDSTSGTGNITDIRANFKGY
mgnify:FL=1|jgi:hypothetical protein|tara:strand:- start:47 stop:457 length:411 start_codon:yes stop_codon:yes gene_type:complete